MPNLPGRASTDDGTRLSIDVGRAIVEPTVVRVNEAFPPDAVAREQPLTRIKPGEDLFNTWCSRSRSHNTGVASTALMVLSTSPAMSQATITSLPNASVRPKSRDNLVLSMPPGLKLR